MKNLIFAVCAIMLISSHLWVQETEADQPKKVIYETDMCLDVDDVGALASLHAMADGGEVELLAVCFNEVHPSGAAAIDAINTWYGRGTILVGIFPSNGVNPKTSSGRRRFMIRDGPHRLSGKTNSG